MDYKNTILLRNVPQNVHTALKHLAVDRGISMNALLLEIIAAAANEKVKKIK